MGLCQSNTPQNKNVNLGKKQTYISEVGTSIIEKQKEYSICKIERNNKMETGFLCVIPYPDQLTKLPVLITCNHIVTGKEKEIKLRLNDNIEKNLSLNDRKIYSDKDKDITIIEIKNEDDFKYSNMLEIDYDIFEDNNYIFNSIYIIYFPLGKESDLSTGMTRSIKNETFDYICNSESGSSGEPILNVDNFKVIGIQKKADKNNSTGMLLKESIINFQKMQDNKTEISPLNNDGVKIDDKKIKTIAINNNIKARKYFDDIGWYEGEFKNGKMEGRGIFYYNTGEKYEGEWKDDKAHGKGKFIYKEENIYEGDWENDKKNGKGIFTFKNRDVYEGDFKNDIKEGKGIYYYNSGKMKGDRYEGDYKNDKKEGKGIYHYHNGDRYEGDFKNDKKEGRGTYHYYNGDKYEGDLINDIKEGKGIFYYNNGDRYEGGYKNNKMEGKGVYYYNNGDKYEGEWKNDKREGKGKLIYLNGHIENCNYLNGEKIKYE